MKKIFVIISTFAIAFCAVAKDLKTLEAEFLALGGDKNAEKAYVEANKADVAIAFSDWAKTDDAKKSVNIWEQQNGKRRLFYFYSVYNHKDVKGVPPLALINVDCWKIKFITAEENPTFYDELKLNGFIINGVELTECKKCWVACRYDDYDYIGSKGIAYVIERIKTVKDNNELVSAFIKARTATWLSGSTDAETELIALRNALIQYNGDESLLDKVNKLLSVVRADAITGSLKK